MQNITVKLDKFEGPFDLLFHLIEKSKIDIYDIPISELTDQYISYINNLENKDMDSMSEFIFMASSLVEIKSKMLLPQDKEDKKEDDPRNELINKLIEYKKFKKAAEVFEERQFYSDTFYFKKHDKAIINYIKSYEKKEIKNTLKDLDINILYKAFEDVLKRKDLITDNIRSNFNSIKKDLFTIEDKIQYIKDLLTLNNQIKFDEMFKKDSTKSEVVTTFLAMLELIKIKEIKAFQKSVFDDIVILKY